MNKKTDIKPVIFTCWLLGAASLGYAKPMASPPPERVPHPENRVPNFKEEIQPPITADKPAVREIHMTREELIASPELLTRALDAALEQDHYQNVAFLLPLYEQIQEPDPIMVLYARAYVATAEGRIHHAIADYRRIIAQAPELTPVRIRLAILLMQDKQLTAAQDQFTKIKSDEALPDDWRQVIEFYEQNLYNDLGWSFSGSLRYLHENNVNNAPDELHYGGWTFSPPEKAHGVGYRVTADRDFLLQDHWYGRLNMAVDGKYYWDNRPYNDFNLRVDLGPAWRNHRQNNALLVFCERRLYGDKAYSRSCGMRADTEQYLHPAWQLYVTAEVAQNRYDDRKHLNGTSRSIYGTLIHRYGPRGYVLMGFNGTDSQSRDISDSYRRIGARVGGGYEWAGGVSASLSLSYGYRWHQAPDFLQIKRHDHDYNAYVSLWHRAWHWHGLTPRLSWQLGKTQSNHPLYKTTQNQAFIEITTRF